MRRLALVTFVLALLGAACGGSENPAVEGGSDTTTAAPSGSAYTVNLDGKTDAFNGEFGSFFPSALTVKPGDTVKFALPRFSGVPHTVTLGTLVDKAVAKIEQLGPQASIEAQETSAEVLNLPDLFPHESPKSGPPDANQSAAQPCFLDTGVPPLSLSGSAPACPKRDQPEFDGTQAFYNSGMLGADGDSFTVKVADSTKPGVYSMICLIHRGVMTGKVTVADAGATVPTPEDVRAKGSQELDAIVQGLTPVAAATLKATPDKAVMGAGDPKYFSTTIAQFGPMSASVPVGGSVTWNVFGFHSLTFGAADSDVVLVSKSPDGAVHLSPKAAPAGFNVPAALGDFPPPANSKPVAVNLGSYDGSGFKSTGVIGSLPPRLVSLKLTFTKAGTYPIRCVIHPDMKGEVKVG
jgi:plastocyanin